MNIRTFPYNLKDMAKCYGLGGVMREGIRRVLRTQIASFREYRRRLDGKGLEIGGPSKIFCAGHLFPVYPVAGRIDNCNFGRNTTWEGSLQPGWNFLYDGRHPPGFQYICEAVELGAIPPNSYDFLLSSHMLEHTANSLRAMHEWKRVLRRSGLIVLVLPHRDGTFDHRRPITELAHLVEDYERGVGEDDLTHLPEILELHDWKKDPGVKGIEEFQRRSQNNIANRCLHHHVFTTKLVVQMLNHVGFQVCAIDPVLPFNIFAIGEKLAANECPDNECFLGEEAPYRRSSPFPSDRSLTRK